MNWCPYRSSDLPDVIPDHPVYLIQNKLPKLFLRRDFLRIAFCKISDYRDIFIVQSSGRGCVVKATRYDHLTVDYHELMVQLAQSSSSSS